MKQFKLLAFMLASSLILSGCLPVKKKSNSGSVSPSGSVAPGGDDGDGGDPTPTPTPTTGWGEADQKLMKDHLDGEVLPYVEGEWSWEYNSEKEYLGGASEDADYSKVKAAYSGWKVKNVDYGLYSFDWALKVHTNGPVFVEMYDNSDFDEGVQLAAYYTPEKTAWSAAEKTEMVSAFGEEFPFLGGKWSDISKKEETDESDEGTGSYYYVTSSVHDYNETKLGQVLKSNGFESVEIEETEEYEAYTLYEKTTSKGYLQAYFKPSEFEELGYAVFYLSSESALVDDKFELAADKSAYLKSEGGTLTLTKGVDVPAGEIEYTVSPASAATVTPTETGATFVFGETTDGQTVTFTVKQGTEYEASVSVKVYDSEIPADLEDLVKVENFTKIKNTTYADDSYTSTNGVKYDVNAAKSDQSPDDKSSVDSHGEFQIRNKDGKAASGLVADGDYLKCKSINFDFNSTNVSTREILIFGSNDSAITLNDMKTNPSNAIGSVKMSDASHVYEFATPYKYIGFCSSYGGIFLVSMTFTWTAA